LLGLLAFLGLLGGLGCRPNQAEPARDDIVAVAGSSLITTKALEAELARRRLSPPTASEKTAALEDLIRFEVFYAGAQRAGYEQKPEVQAAIKQLLVAQYRESLATNYPSSSQITEEEITDYYHRHADRYGTPAQVRAALIFLPVPAKAVPEKRAEARQRAEDIRALALADAAATPTFGLLAQTHSAHQPSRFHGGDQGWLTRAACEREWEPAVAAAVFSLSEPKSLSPVIEGKDGLYLCKLMERLPAALKPLAEVREGIVYQLRRVKAEQEQQQQYAQLKAQIGVKINQAALARVATNASAQKPPSLPSQ
jgi:parvulin-like peptidyl-prolyl isomerase